MSESVYLEVGKVYLNRAKQIIEIKSEYLKAFHGLNLFTKEWHWYFPDGKIAPIHDMPNGDIVSEATASDYLRIIDSIVRQIVKEEIAKIYNTNKQYNHVQQQHTEQP